MNLSSLDCQWYLGRGTLLSSVVESILNLSMDSPPILFINDRDEKRDNRGSWGLFEALSRFRPKAQLFIEVFRLMSLDYYLN